MLDGKRFTVEALLSDASKKCGGLTDFGPDEFSFAMEVLLDSILGESQMACPALEQFRRICIELLCNRLRIQEIIRQVPSILDQPIRSPIFATGLPRSGSTLLQDLFSLDPGTRTLKLFELMSPAPRSVDERDKLSKDRMEFAEEFVNIRPRLAKLHRTGVHDPEECQKGLLCTFKEIYFDYLFYCPSYVKWVNTQDLTGLYRFYKKMIQVLLWQRACPKDGRVVLKCPDIHFENIDRVFAVFPDANVIVQTRDLKSVIGSACSLTKATRYDLRMISDLDRGEMNPAIDPHVIGRECVEKYVHILKSYRSRLSKLDPRLASRVVTLDYPDFMTSQVHSIELIYSKFGIEFSADYERRMRAWLAKHSKPTHEHRYKLEEYGLTDDQVDQVFAGTLTSEMAQG